MKPFWIAFFAAEVVMLGLWWLTGFNFDHRSPDVALGAFVTLLSGFAVGSFGMATKQ